MKMLLRPRFLLLAALGGAVPQALLAQAPAALPAAPPTTGTMSLSLQQAVSYAIQNKSTLLATRLGEATAAAKVGEIKQRRPAAGERGRHGVRQLQAAKEPGELPGLSQTLLTQGDLGCGPSNGRAAGAGHPAAGVAAAAVRLRPAIRRQRQRLGVAAAVRRLVPDWLEGR